MAGAAVRCMLSFLASLRRRGRAVRSRRGPRPRRIWDLYILTSTLLDLTQRRRLGRRARVPNVTYEKAEWFGGQTGDIHNKTIPLFVYIVVLLSCVRGTFVICECCRCSQPCSSSGAHRRSGMPSPLVPTHGGSAGCRAVFRDKKRPPAGRWTDVNTGDRLPGSCIWKGLLSRQPSAKSRVVERSKDTQARTPVV